MGDVRNNVLNRALLNPITVYSGGVPVAGYAADKLADAVAKAGVLASATAPVVVELSAGTYTLAAGLTIPAYTTLSGNGDVIITGAGGDKGILCPQSHSRISGLVIDLTTATNFGIHLEQSTAEPYTCTDVWLTNNTFRNGNMSIGCSDIDCALSDVHIIGNSLCGGWPIRICPASAARIEVVGNTQLSERADVATNCYGFLDIVPISGASYGHTIANNVIRARRTLTSQGVNTSHYGMIVGGWGNTIADNVIEFIQNHITPGAAAGTLHNYGIWLQAEPTLPASGETVVRPNVVTGNSIILRNTGDSTATVVDYAAIAVTCASADTAMPVLMVGDNTFVIETEQASLVKYRLSVAQTFATPGSVVVLPDAFVGAESYADSITNATITSQRGSVDIISNSMVAGETITAGLLVYLKSDGKWWKADAGSNLPAAGVALTGGTANASIVVARRGRVTGYSGMTVGLPYFLGAAGAATDSENSTMFETNQTIGFALSATEMYVDIGGHKLNL